MKIRNARGLAMALRQKLAKNRRAGRNAMTVAEANRVLREVYGPDKPAKGEH